MQLFSFQIEALETLKPFKSCALYCDMGLGKTFMGSEKLISLNAETNLVVCQKSKVADWTEHFKTHYSFQVFDLTKPKACDEFINSSERRIGVINYDILFRRPKITSIPNMAVLYDESSSLKNEKAKRTKTALSIKSCANILLSGTPIGGKYEQLWSQCKLLGWNIKRDEFWRTYVIYTDWCPPGLGHPIKLVKGYKNTEDLKQKLREHGAYFLKSEDVISLPDQQFIDINIPETKEAKRFAKTFFVEAFDKVFKGDTPFNKLLCSRQLASSYNKFKLDAFADLIESTSDRIVVFYNTWDEFDKLKSIITKAGRPISAVNGKERDLSNYTNHSDSITLIQYSAGATGLNLQLAQFTIYFSPTLSSELYEQSKKRTHRIGQNNRCVYYKLICGKVEQKIYSVLKRRQDFTIDLFE